MGVSVGFLEQVRGLLTRGEWAEARRHLQAAPEHGEIPEALEALGMAAWGMNDAALVFHARERAYKLYRQDDNACGAARVAIALSMDYLYFRGENAIAMGWVQRARRLLEDEEACAEEGWLAVAEAQLLMWTDHDFVTAQRLSSRAVDVGKNMADIDLQMVALASEGLSFVSQGKVREGMRRLDEATTAAVSGEMSDIDAACTACCCLIYACEWTRDYQRARQWIGRMRDLAHRWSHPTLIAFCRIHYATLLIWQGDWAEAETELQAATEKLEQTQPAMAAEGFVRLAELRCKQGRFEEARALLERAETPPFRALVAELCLCGRAALAFAEGEADEAVELAERFLRAVPRADRMERVAALEVLIAALCASGALTEAEEVLGELRETAREVATNPLRASVHFADGLLAAAKGDHTRAKHCFEDAIDLWNRAGAPFETARARLELARSLRALDRTAGAEAQARKALAAFEELGAAPSATLTEALLDALNGSPEPGSALPSDSDLTQREEETLRLVATGKSNQEIADTLFVSVRTVERHLSNIYQKLGLSGKSARAAAVAYALKNGIA